MRKYHRGLRSKLEKSRIWKFNPGNYPPWTTSVLLLVSPLHILHSTAQTFPRVLKLGLPREYSHCQIILLLLCCLHIWKEIAKFCRTFNKGYIPFKCFHFHSKYTFLTTCIERRELKARKIVSLAILTNKQTINRQTLQFNQSNKQTETSYQ